MIDIMLFLLVFFAMMTLKMIPTSGQVSKLPTSSTASAIPAPKLLIEIRGNGQLLAEGREVEPAQITALVKSRDAANLAVTIAGSEDASMQHLMKAVDAVRLGGATQIGLAAKQVSR
jgi:biopolymer transport protein ExbD